MTSEEIRCTFLAGFSVEAISYTKGRQKDWENVLDELAFIPVAYQRLQLDYQETYMRAFVDELVDLSVIFYHGGKPVGIWPVSLLCRDGVWQMGTNQGRVLPPLFVPALSERLLRKCGGACLDAMDRLHAELTKIMEFSEKWGGQASFLPSPLYPQLLLWEAQCMERGARAAVEHELYVDLSLSETEIHQHLRKSYRSLLHEGEKIWHVTVLDDVDHETFTAYRLLHRAVAGRVTRPIETWDLQEKAIHEDRDFLVLLHDQEDYLIGGGLFSATRDMSSYGVGAYDRSLFDKPVSHIVQWAAILHAKELGCRWHYIGARFYPGDERKATEKELSIAYYKEGFATNRFLNVLLDVPFKK